MCNGQRAERNVFFQQSADSYSGPLELEPDVQVKLR